MLFVAPQRFFQVTERVRGIMGSVVYEPLVSVLCPLPGSRMGLQFPAGSRAREGTRGKGAERVKGGRVRESASGGRGFGGLSRRHPRIPDRFRAVAARPARGRAFPEWPCRRRAPLHSLALAGPSHLCRDAGEPGARRGREVEPAGAANAKLAGAAVPVCARGRAAPLAAAALPAARPRLRGWPGR